MHVFARLAGHGVTVVPQVPYAFERHGGRGGDAVVVTHRPPAGLPRRLVLVPEAGGCRVEPGAGVAVASEVADVLEAADAAGGAGPGPWTIETPRFSMGWPEGFVLQSGPAPEEPPGFDLVAPGGVLLFPQGPFPPERLADRRALAGPGHRVAGEGEADGAGWVEFTYVHEQTAWRQRHTLVLVGAGVLVLTLQAPEASVDAPCWRAALEAAKTVRPA